VDQGTFPGNVTTAFEVRRPLMRVAVVGLGRVGRFYAQTIVARAAI
jgi:hypothetical protein